MKQLSIRQYVEWLTLIPLLIMATGLETYFLHDRSVALDSDLMERGKLIARQLASSSEYGVFSNNKLFLQNIAQGVLQQPDVRGVIILNAASESLIETGELSYEAGNQADDANLAMSEHSRQTGQTRFSKVIELVNLQTPVFINSGSLWFYQPIISAQVALDDLGIKPAAQQVGGVIVEMNRARTESLKSQTLWVTIGATGLFLMLSFYLVYRASQRITFPIRELSDAVQKIGAGHLETRVSVSTHVAELSTLARGINDMAVQLKQESVTLHQQVEEATRLAAIAFESHEGMMVTDANGVIMRVNSAFTRMTGYMDKDAVGRTPRLLKSGHHDTDFFAAIWESVRRTGSWQGEIWNRNKNGATYPAWATITEVKREDGRIAYYVATYTDITSRKAAENEIKNLAFYDALTQVPNRRMLIDRLSLAMAASKRTGRYGAVMFLDLDNFKPLNDQYGHAVGDLLLVEVARRLISCVREVDTVARFGGDEFVVMLSELDVDKAESIMQASVVAEKIRVILAEPYELPIQQNGLATNNVYHHCTSSIGVVMFINHDASPGTVLTWADMAMYKAKRDGRNLIRFYEQCVLLVSPPKIN
jgi:diguanylate cyclase (GGDEF)-like protein/PAS domain S-box-containing protein